MSINTSNKVLPDLSKLEPLDGTNDSHWSQKLLIFLKQLDVDYVLTINLPSDPPAITPPPSNPESSTRPSATATNQVKKDQVIDPKKYAKGNKTVPGHMLNHVSDPMFDLFVAQKSAKSI